MKTPEEKAILDDIDFGSDIEMIKGKIISGAYHTEPYQVMDNYYNNYCPFCGLKIERI